MVNRSTYIEYYLTLQQPIPVLEIRIGISLSHLIKIKWIHNFWNVLLKPQEFTPEEEGDGTEIEKLGSVG